MWVRRCRFMLGRLVKLLPQISQMYGFSPGGWRWAAGCHWGAATPQPGASLPAPVEPQWGSALARQDPPHPGALCTSLTDPGRWGAWPPASEGQTQVRGGEGRGHARHPEQGRDWSGLAPSPSPAAVPVWVFMCSSKYCFMLKSLPHHWHMNCLWPMWMLMCDRSWYLYWKRSLQF